MRTREPDGKKTRELGACPAAAETKLDGVNDGKNGGRSCWAIAGTLSEGETQGTYAQKLGNCLKYMISMPLYAASSMGNMQAQKRFWISFTGKLQRVA
jgi:hypothetical protein